MTYTCFSPFLRTNLCQQYFDGVQNCHELYATKGDKVSLLILQVRNVSTGFVPFGNHYIHFLKETLQYLNPLILNT